MKTVREMFVSLTTMLINHIWASIIEICVEKWRTQSLKKFEIQMSRHEKRYRSEEMAPIVPDVYLFLPCGVPGVLVDDEGPGQPGENIGEGYGGG